MQVKFLNVKGVSTRIIYAGEGYPVIFLHGVGLSADTFFRNIDVLATRMQVVAVDMLGHGFTDFGNVVDGAPHPHLVEHVIAVADELGLQEFAIAGSSFGAQIACLVHLRDPARVRGLYIIGSGSSFNTEQELVSSLKMLRENALKALRNPTLESCRSRLENMIFSSEAVPEELLLVQLTSYARPGLKEIYERIIEVMLDVDLTRQYRIRDRLKEIACPTQIVWGKQDTRGKYERAVEAQTAIEGSELVAFDDCGHLPYVEYPQRFNDAFSDFFERRILKKMD